MIIKKGYEIDKLEKVEKSAKDMKKNYANLIQVFFFPFIFYQKFFNKFFNSK